MFWGKLTGEPPVKNQNEANFTCFVKGTVPLFNHTHSGGKMLDGSVKTYEWCTES